MRNSSGASYRAEIDGLRAIAVVSVVLYHAKFIWFGRDWFEGGFIGVDIFFTISGYLITRIILSEFNEQGVFSFANFYERRARRILPMLLLIVFVSFPFAWQNLLPSDFVEYAESILASLFFGSNFFFYFSTTEYGADSALLKPLLHTWSLGVEEQFYLAFPILAIFVYKYLKKQFLIILLGLLLLSLQFSDFLEVRNSSLNFYLPFSRFWELATGSVLAYLELYHKLERNNPWIGILPTIGLCLILYSILFFNGETPHPSYYTVIPILGVALIIGFASRTEFIGKILGTKPFVGIGLISYSVYLWHFPIFAFARVSLIELSGSFKGVLIFITLILSVISYQFVEKPFRNRKLITGKLFFSIIGIFFALCSAAAMIVVKMDGLPKRFNLYTTSGKELTFYRKNYWADFSPFLNGKKGELIDFDDGGDSKLHVLVIGNSWAHDIAVSLAINEDVEVQYEGMTGINCKEFILTTLTEAEKNYENMHMRCAQNFSRFSHIPKNTDVVILADHIFHAGQYDEPDVREAFNRTLTEIRKNFDGKLVVVKGRPQWKRSGFRLMTEVPSLSRNSNELVQKYLKVNLEEMRKADAYYENFYSEHGIIYVGLVETFCPDDVCELFGDREIYYFDGMHLTKSGAHRVSSYLRTRIE